MKSIYLTIFCLLTYSILKAKENPTTVVDSTAKKSPLTINGFVDTYYFGNFNTPKSMSNGGRVFDQRAGQFQVGYADLKTTYSTDKVDAVIDLAFGNSADLVNYGNLGSQLPGVTSTALAIKQAYLTWRLSNNLSLTGGQYATHVGYEVVDSPVNYNFSLSNLFANQPFYHTGLKLNYTVSSKVSLMVGVVNAIDSKDALSRNKGFTAQMVITPKTGYAFYLNYISADKATLTTPVNYSVFDVVANMQLTSKFYAGANVDFGTVDSKSWSGYAVYSNYAISSKFGLGARYEYIDNANAGLVGVLTRGGKGTSMNSFTLTGNISVTDNLMLKPEFRLDTYPTAGSGVEQFEDSNGKFTNTSQATFGGALIFHF